MSWIKAWIDKYLGGDATLHAPPREWRPGVEAFSDYVEDVVHNRYGMTERRDFDVPPDQFLQLLSQTLVNGSTEISELVIATRNGKARVRAREGATAGVQIILGHDGEVSYRTGQMDPWPDPGPGDEGPRRPRGFGATRETA